MAYTETFITIAPDTKAIQSEIPVPKHAQKPIHVIQYELLTDKPYHYTHKDLVFAVHVEREGISHAELEQNREQIWDALFQKGHPCLRASSLTKRYGWGAHYDTQGKIAIYPMESDKYQQFLENANGNLTILAAMNSKRRK